MTTLQRVAIGTPPPGKDAPRIDQLRWVRRVMYYRPLPLEALCFALLLVYHSYVFAVIMGAWGVIGFASLSAHIRYEQRKQRR
jgi:hypothetical protein